jgi:RNA polymerase sigma-70 factor (ECF subfamily)
VDAGNPDEGFSEAFDRYAPAILGYAQRRLKDPDAAWDVVTDAFTSAWRHWDARPDPDQVLPWLYAIAGNSVRSQWRSSARQRRLLARLSAAPPAASQADPAEGVVVSRAMNEALARLPEADREVLILIACEGQTDAHALGLALGLSPAGTRSRIHRARRRLRAVLAEADNPAPGAAAQRTRSVVREHAKEA